MDQDIVAQLNTSHARAITASAGVQEMNNNIIGQLGVIIARAADYDSRLLNGFLAAQLFDQELVQSKAGFYSPIAPGSAPVAAPPSVAAGS